MNLINAMKTALGDLIDPVSFQAMEVSAVMAQAGASKEDIEEMMALLLSQGTGVSPDFIDAVKEAITSGGKMIVLAIFRITCFITLDGATG